MRAVFYIISAISLLLVFTLHFYWRPALYLLIVIIPYIVIGIYDIYFTTHNVLINYPVIGHLRYMLEFIRPEVQQYFVASNTSGRPYNREVRSLVYQRAQHERDTLPFGTQQNIRENGYELAYHSLAPQQVPAGEKRILVGGEQCGRPYDASRFNISAMSYGALSPTAILAMNLGAKKGGFAQDTGEGGISKFHLQHGGDLIWEVGTAYFGCRTENGEFDPQTFKEKSRHPNVKMIEIKLSQGAKPSHGGLLPGIKVTLPIARARGIMVGKDCLSPPAHATFSTPEGLLQFMQQLRELSDGKPVGFKLCIGKRHEFMGICKAMLSTGIIPDFITIDGAEGGTGAAPVEFTNRLGMPINEALIFVNNCLRGIKLRDKIRIIAAGKVATGFDMLSKFALGADMCNAARAMMFAVGCIQALRCNTNECPTGVTTQDEARMAAIDVAHKSDHVQHYQHATLESCFDLIGAMGYSQISELSAADIYRRSDAEKALPYSEVFPHLAEGALLQTDIHPGYAADWHAASSDRF